MTLELRLMGTQLAFGVGDPIRHGVERLGQHIEFRQPATWRARIAVAGSDLASRGDQAPHGQADAEGEQYRNQQSDSYYGGACHRQRLFGDRSRCSCVRSGRQQIAAGGLLKLLFDARDQRGALFEEFVARLAVDAVEFFHCMAHAHGEREVLAFHVEPVAARRAQQLGRMRTQSRFELLLALGVDGCNIDVAAHRVDGRCQLGERAHGDDLVPVDGQARSTGGSDSLFNSLESGVALACPSGAL